MHFSFVLFFCVCFVLFINFCISSLANSCHVYSVNLRGEQSRVAGVGVVDSNR